MNIIKYDESVTIGSWYTIDDSIWCVTKIGSNYYELTDVYSRTYRVLKSEFCGHERLDNPSEYVQQKLKSIQLQISEKMESIREINSNLLIQGDFSKNSSAIVPSAYSDRVDNYKLSLIEAEGKTLPDLFQSVKDLNKELSIWMCAGAIPVRSQIKNFSDIKNDLQQKIHAVELYSGIQEDLVHIKSGVFGSRDEKIHLLQRRHYMDEECLIGYKAGGIDISSIEKFDAWLSQEENFERILPFEKCVVGFRVRRFEKDRYPTGFHDFIRCITSSSEDKKTFLYIRNGQNLFRLDTNIEIQHELFPDSDVFGGEKLYAKVFSGSVREFIRKSEFDFLQEQKEKQTREYEQALRDDPDNAYKHAPSAGFYQYHPYDESSVYFDDMSDFIRDELMKQRHLVLILQGLLDRSVVFDPHPGWNLFKPHDFLQAVKPVYDVSRALTSAEKPNIEEFFNNCNKGIRAGSVTVGQEVLWEMEQAVVETQRLRRHGIFRDFALHRFSPPDDPGPGTFAKVYQVKNGNVIYAWNKEYVGKDGNLKKVRKTFKCPINQVLDVGGYRAGQFRQFYDDPRTRSDYLTWAPLLLLAENYAIQNINVADPPQAKRQKSSYSGRVIYEARKYAKGLVGKTVYLLSDTHMRDGTLYPKGSQWTVLSARGKKVDLKSTSSSGRINGIEAQRLKL